MWRKLLDDTQKEFRLANIKEASLNLELKMQKEAWHQGLKSVNTLETRLKQQILSKSPFTDKNDGLIKVGGRLTMSDLEFGRQHPTIIPDTELGDALVGYLHSNTPHQGR